MEKNKYYSQNRQEKYIVEYFGDFVGTFLDIGAYDGKCFSNTYRLSELGWSGICIEPSPSVFPTLKNLYKSNKNIQTVPVAIHPTNSGKLKFYDSFGDAISSFDKQHVEYWRTVKNGKFQPILVDTITVSKMFERYGTQHDFISLDTEGLSLDILKKFPFDKLKNKLICIEYDNHTIEISKLLFSKGYETLRVVGGDILFNKK